jgi:HAD superfamily hydrolase (TIGR01509 family)
MGKSVIWDMDGVLVDTGEFHLASWLEIMPAFNLPFSEALFRQTFGMNNTGVLTTLMGEPPSPELVRAVSDRKEARFREMIRGQAVPLPGVTDWLAQLRQAGFTHAVASSAPPANIDALIDELQLRPYFVALVSGFDIPGKPDPGVFLQAAAALGSAPEQCVVVEDAVAGVEAARRAGMKCIAVTTTNPAHLLRAADIVVNRLPDLPPMAFDRLLRP